MASVFTHISPAGFQLLQFARQRSGSFFAAIWAAFSVDFLRPVLIGVAILDIARQRGRFICLFLFRPFLSVCHFVCTCQALRGKWVCPLLFKCWDVNVGFDSLYLLTVIYFLSFQVEVKFKMVRWRESDAAAAGVVIAWSQRHGQS